MGYYQHWSSTKKQFSKKASANFSKAGLKVFGKGANFRPALKKFEMQLEKMLNRQNRATAPKR